MANGDISWSGRALRAVLWRAPLWATKRTTAGYMATVEDVGRRGLAVAGFGLWVFGVWWLAGWTGIQGFQEVAAFLVLVWFWRFFVFCRWVYKMRTAALRARAMQRKQAELLEKLAGQVQQWGRQAIPSGGSFTVLGMTRQSDPGAEEVRRMAAHQARQGRDLLSDEDRDAPLGDQFEPVLRMPRWIRKRRPK
jgi:hypothetical protein